ncbi:MAG: DUF7305 domain-containing protein [Candidatus Xenobia bacterium]
MRRRPRGIAIVTVLLVLTLMFIIGGVMVQSTIVNQLQAQHAFVSREAFYAANAGIETMLLELQRNVPGNPTWSQTLTNVPMPNVAASYSVVVTNNCTGQSAVLSSNGVSVPPGFIYVLATGVDTPSGTSQQIGAMLQVPITTNFAVFGSSGVTLSGNKSVIDSFDSSKGVVPPQILTAPANVSVGTLGAVSLSGGGSIDGNVLLGPGESAASAVTTSGGSAVTGVVSNLSTAPTVLPAPTPLGVVGAAVSTSTSMTLSPGNYQSLQVTGGTVTLLSGTYYFPGGVVLSGNSSIAIQASNGPVNVVFGGTFDISGGSVVNDGGVPSTFNITGTAAATSATLTGGTSACFVFNAITADVTISGGSNVYGAIVAHSVDDTGGSDIVYDIRQGTKIVYGVPQPVSWERL